MADVMEERRRHSLMTPQTADLVTTQERDGNGQKGHWKVKRLLELMQMLTPSGEFVRIVADQDECLSTI